MSELSIRKQRDPLEPLQTAVVGLLTLTNDLRPGPMPRAVPEPTAEDDAQPHAIGVHLDRLLEERGMTLTELADRVGISVVNLSILKNGHAKAIRFTTLTGICEALDCQPGDLLSFRGLSR